MKVAILGAGAWGTALGVAAEAGLMEWGDGLRAMQLMEEVRKGTAMVGSIKDKISEITSTTVAYERSNCQR